MSPAVAIAEVRAISLTSPSADIDRAAAELPTAPRGVGWTPVHQMSVQCDPLGWGSLGKANVVAK